MIPVHKIQVKTLHLIWLWRSFWHIWPPPLSQNIFPRFADSSSLHISLFTDPFQFHCQQPVLSSTSTCTTSWVPCSSHSISLPKWLWELPQVPPMLQWLPKCPGCLQPRLLQWATNSQILLCHQSISLLIDCWNSTWPKWNQWSFSQSDFSIISVFVNDTILHSDAHSRMWVSSSALFFIPPQPINHHVLSILLPKYL